MVDTVCDTVDVGVDAASPYARLVGKSTAGFDEKLFFQLGAVEFFPSGSIGNLRSETSFTTIRVADAPMLTADSTTPKTDPIASVIFVEGRKQVLIWIHFNELAQL
jgi:hypothetical protein